MVTSVFVSGASGFIAQHVVKQLIEKGYKVVGTVRSTEKGERLKKNLGTDDFTYEIVKDIAAPNAFDEALKKHPEVTVFLHTASPFHFNTTEYEKDLLIPAVSGTKNALSSIKNFGPQITNLVVTSSFAAITTLVPETSDVPPFTEKSWNPITYEQALENAGYAYRGSKTFAEKAVWEFKEKETPNFKVNTVNPVFVFGPQAFDDEIADVMNTSSEFLNQYLQTTPDAEVSDTPNNFVDVRDVARAHLHAFESDVTDFRYFLYASTFVGQDIVDIINSKIPDLKGKVPVGEPGSGPAKYATRRKLDNSETLKLIGPFIDLETSVVDSLQQIIDKKKSA